MLSLPSNDPLRGGKDSLKLRELMDLCTHLSNKVLELESEVIDIKSTYKKMIEKLEGIVDRLEEENKVLKELYSVYSKVDIVAPVVEKEKSFKQERIIAYINEDVEINLEEAQAKPYTMDLEHPEKLLLVEQLLLLKQQRSVFQGEEGVLLFKTLRKQHQQLLYIQRSKLKTKEKNVVIEQVKRSESLNDVVMKYQALNRKPLTEAQAKKNMIIYLKNMAGYKMNYFKGMTYSEIILIFSNHYNYNQVFLEEVNEEVTVPEKEVEVEESLEAYQRKVEKTEPKNYTDDNLLLLKPMYREIKRRYPLTHFTLEKMLNNVRLEVEEESEMSLELL
nr:hypothetical protein [Tanacetum cinerariifolium]